MTTVDEILEGTTPIYPANLIDEYGTAVAAASLTAVWLTFYSLENGAIINNREGQNILNANNVTISNAGALAWKLMEADTILASPKPPLGHHRAVFVYKWLDAEGTARQKVHEVTFPIRQVPNAPFAA